MRDRILRFVVYAGVGVLTGLVVAVVELVAVEWLLHDVLEAPLWVRVITPGLGLLFAVLFLRWVGKGMSPAMSARRVSSFWAAVISSIVPAG